MNRFSRLLRLSAVRQAFGFLILFFTISIVAWGGTFLLVSWEMQRIVDARLMERMDAAIASLDAGVALPATEADETAGFVDGDEKEGLRTEDLEGSSVEMRYLVRTTSHGRLQIGENTELQEELRDILAGGMQISLLATILLTAIAGLWMARRSQDRLDTVSIGLAKVAQGDLGARIALEGNDDISLLADRIDGTTARLETLVMQMRVQSSNIAHDLRTPLARLRAQLETNLLALIERDRPVKTDDLENALEQIDRITGTFEALLRLARIESGAGRDAFKTMRLEELIAEIVDTYGPVVEEAGQTLEVTVQDAASIAGDHDMLVQLLANLIQNALRHGAANQTISIGVHGPRLIVTDEGPGIPFGERENVLQPLHQGEATRQGEGFGLGLSLVRAISELHSAELSLSDGPNGRGLCVTVNFPRLTDL
ncbi:HAMP domain-containing sensor histidine kinase [Cognatiyoonia sp. IB215446]|uniref:sensor histidine kinase n=1 Tax=Cognatiyoonia sp. IB215446 TaxID=3097355 RepID=UPI002A0D1B6D|nr:HAMP domain-containing sensor histidine kinase [Cognatiyoonia sp. IB215446]MDX8348657.1 HAMP domain-containing sensor histidine kinase [Cognatiyoonia sp. IB215446]